MALPWTDFVWTIKRWLSLYPLETSNVLPATTPSSGNYTLAAKAITGTPSYVTGSINTREDQ